ncbi:long-chain-fatty-acid--coa ligase, partial [Plakobranchus ocellatus]
MGRTIGEHLKALSDEYPSKDIFVFYDRNLKKTSITFRELHRLGSSVELAVAFYGAMMAGAKTVSCEIIMDKAEVFHHCINRSEAVLIVVRTDPNDLTWNAIKANVASFERDDQMAEIHDPTMPNLKTVFFANRPDENNDVQGFLAMLRTYPESFEDTESEDTDTCSMWLTSGTTGMPKLAMKSHKSLAIASVIEDGFFPGQKDKRHFCNAPWSWAVCSPFDVMNGNTRVQPELWTKPADLYKLCAEILKTEEPPAAFLTPPEIEGILKYWNLKEKKIIDTLCVAGYPVSHAMCEWFLTVTNNLVVRYGCSELITISCNVISDINKYKDFDCGKLCE